jgi:hypothetical protein
MCVHDVFAMKFSSFMCYDTISYYDSTTLILTSLINVPHQIFANMTCMILLLMILSLGLVLSCVDASIFRHCGFSTPLAFSTPHRSTSIKPWASHGRFRIITTAMRRAPLVEMGTVRPDRLRT